tara:strand:+ start:29318 stop:30238 length:921 start_codon:yes stop_codon:yes gene_type:complete
MSGFGKQVEVGEGIQRKLFTGAENFKVVGINPTKAELETLYGREINFDPEYIGTTKVTDSDGEREVPQIRLDFYLANEENTVTTKLQFYIADTHHKSQTGKYKVINSFGRDTWLDQDAIKTKQIPDNMSWYKVDGVKVAKRGEVELISFLVNLLNLPWDLSKVDDPSEAYAQISKEEWVKIFAGDTTLLRNVVDSTNNKIGVLLGVKTKGDGKLVQTTFNRHTLRQYVVAGSKNEKYKYILKDLDEAVAAGAFGNVNFGPRDLAIREHEITPTAISTENTNQLDVFATADAPAEEVTADDDDWLNG